MTKLDNISGLVNEAKKLLGQSILSDNPNIDWTKASVECQILIHETFAKYGGTIGHAVADAVINNKRWFEKNWIERDPFSGFYKAGRRDIRNNLIAAFLFILKAENMLDPKLKPVVEAHPYAVFAALSVRDVVKSDKVSTWASIRRHLIAECRLASGNTAYCGYSDDLMSARYGLDFADIYVLMDEIGRNLPDVIYCDRVIRTPSLGFINAYDNMGFSPLVFWTGMEVKPTWGPAISISSDAFKDMHLNSAPLGNPCDSHKYCVLMDLAIGPFKKAGLDKAILAGAKIIVRGIEVPQVAGFGRRKYCPSRARMGTLELVYADWDDVRALAIFSVASYEKIGHDSASVAAVKTLVEGDFLDKDLISDEEGAVFSEPDVYGYENGRLGDSRWLFGEGGKLWSSLERNTIFATGKETVKRCEEEIDYGTD